MHHKRRQANQHCRLAFQFCPGDRVLYVTLSRAVCLLSKNYPPTYMGPFKFIVKVNLVICFLLLPPSRFSNSLQQPTTCSVTYLTASPCQSHASCTPLFLRCFQLITQRKHSCYFLFDFYSLVCFIIP